MDDTSRKPPYFAWGIFDGDGKVALEVFDVGEDRRIFKIESDPDGCSSTLILTEREARCILKHLQTAVIYIDGYLGETP